MRGAKGDGTFLAEMKKRKVNPKRRLRAAAGADEARQATLRALSERALYRGNPDHKRSPGDFGLTPPSNRRETALVRV
jgi:hypothetical protein